jgi:ABC-type amino acid transport substrate-binding protein
MNIKLLSCIVVLIFFAGFEKVKAQENPDSVVKECGPETKLCIGVRSHARPFSYKSSFSGDGASDAARGPLRIAGYTGYIVRICDAVLAEMILERKMVLEPNAKEPNMRSTLQFEDIGYYDIDQKKAEIERENERLSAMRLPTKPTDVRFPNLGGKFDILCDPATITNDRRDKNYFVSAPLFLTGVSYITRRGETPPKKKDACKGLIGVVGGTTAPKEGIRALLNANELPSYKDELMSFLRDENLGCLPDEKRPIVKNYQTHSAAAQAFCKGEFYYYVGDLEIITENVKAVVGCDYDNGTSTYTNDRYAIFGSAISGHTERKLLVAKFFEILSQKVVFYPSVLTKAFSDTFQGVSPSRKLELFFWSVSGEKSESR